MGGANNSKGRRGRGHGIGFSSSDNGDGPERGYRARPWGSKVCCHRKERCGRNSGYGMRRHAWGRVMIGGNNYRDGEEKIRILC